MSTSWLILAGGLTLLLGFLLWVGLLRLGLHWTGVPDVSLRKVVQASALIFLVWMACGAAAVAAFSQGSKVWSAVGLALLAAGVCLPWALLGWRFQIGLGKVVLAWLIALVGPLGLALTAGMVVSVLFVQGFSIPTNAMAPTLLGIHQRGVCPECGQPHYGSPPDSHFGQDPLPPMICDNFHIHDAAQLAPEIYQGDRILVAKFLQPRRWDLVVFRYPVEPDTLFVMRLVGLPGETVHVQDGAVWIDGQRQTPPEAIRGIRYLDRVADNYTVAWGTVQRPAVLVRDEYFVLGDFTERSLDSRFWSDTGKGSPYAVHKSHLIGVVTHTYWPLHRWRVHQ